MFVPGSYTVALIFMVISMLAWGSWANTLKMVPDWPFQLFYWDYVVGMLIAMLIWGLTLGSSAGGAATLAPNLGSAGGLAVLYALAGGAVFNIANLLLVAAISELGWQWRFRSGSALRLWLALSLITA